MTPLLSLSVRRMVATVLSARGAVKISPRCTVTPALFMRGRLRLNEGGAPEIEAANGRTVGNPPNGDTWTVENFSVNPPKILTAEALGNQSVTISFVG
jgi:hypothetical protein